MNAVLIIDKPSGLTSHDVVNRARRILRERSIGHLGTLDPMATGVLPLVIGNLTRLARFYTSAEKTYEGTIRFGFSTDTYDAEGEPTSTAQPVTLNPDEIHALAARFRGIIEQTPPSFSAKKIHGVPAYKLARKQRAGKQSAGKQPVGEQLADHQNEVILQPVQVEIKEFEILSVEADRVTFRARVASGTYMRSVAHDMGQALSCGAHLESLRRSAVAEFTLEDAHTLEEVAAATVARAPSPAGSVGTAENSLPVSLADSTDTHETPRAGAAPDTLAALFVHPRKLLPQLPSVTADEPTAARIRSGRTINLPELSRARQIKVFANQTDLLAIATRVAGTLFHPKIVLCGSETPVRRA